VTARVVLTTKVASITGSLAAPAAGAAKIALVFADDPIRWNSSLAFRMSGVDAEGRFEIGGLAPGRYRVAALKQLPEDFGHPALFESLRPNAALVELEEGETETVELSRLLSP